jgi:hypothetical protein
MMNGSTDATRLYGNGSSVSSVRVVPLVAGATTPRSQLVTVRAIKASDVAYRAVRI